MSHKTAADILSQKNSSTDKSSQGQKKLPREPILTGRIRKGFHDDFDGFNAKF